MEVEGDGVRGSRPRDLGQARRIEHEQERQLLFDVEHHRQQHPVILGCGGRRGHEDRLARIKTRRVPGGDRAGFRIDLDDGIEEIASGLNARAPDIAVGFAGVALVVDARQFERNVRQNAAGDRRVVGDGNMKPRQRTGRRDWRA